MEMREIKNSNIEWVGNIPATWDVAYLSAIFSERKNKNIGFTEQNLLSLSYGNVKRKDISTNEGLLPESFEGYNIIEKDDIVLRLTDLQNDHKSLRTGLCKERGIITSAYCTLKRNTDDSDARYLQYYLHSFDVAKGFYGMGAGVRQGLNFDGIRKIEILLPPLYEQEKIANAIDIGVSKVDCLIANQESQIEKLKAYKQSLITEVVTKGIDPNVTMKDSGVEWVKTIPNNWDMVYPKALFAQRKDRALPTDEQLTASQQYGIMNQQEYMRVTGSRVVVVEKDFSILKHVSKGDFVISMRSFQGGLEYSEVEGCISSAYVMLKPNSEKVFPKYYRWLLKSSLYINSLQSTSDLIRDGQAMRFANFIKIWLPCPPFEEQQQIASYLDDVCPKIDSLIAIKQSKIEKLNQYKRSLIYEYVTGKKEVM